VKTMWRLRCEAGGQSIPRVAAQAFVDSKQIGGRHEIDVRAAFMCSTKWAQNSVAAFGILGCPAPGFDPVSARGIRSVREIGGIPEFGVTNSVGW